ncbi:hypothetical protein [Azospirillum rugosum]|uniref:1,4-alpha-glucan branching enzyme n=1 Tax=Azospirillum rugosum TaxID=416170 RepID=A0ABS4SD76_9PROT|nr:hypothetical protein [Azospirillum rugosum]MBP2290522.1 hypothetical protein [Azospirillum rugosum]MDQ0525410.1 hypothetical protein [Azospirillum rugosum]
MAKTTTDHDEIRHWAESHGGKPAVVRSTHHEGTKSRKTGVGLLRLMFPKARQSDHDELEEIQWDEFFKQFEDSKLALLYEEGSNFNKLIGRDTAEKREHGDHKAARH